MNKELKQVKANLEYLKKLFIMPDSPDKFIEFGQELLKMIHDFFKEQGGIHSSISLPELSRIFDRTAIPEDPHRFTPRQVREQLTRWQKERKETRSSRKIKALDRNIRKVNPIVNAPNIELHKALRRDDTTFVSRTKLESTRYRPQNIVVLRAVLINPLTDGAVLKQIVETRNRIGLALWTEFSGPYQRVVTLSHHA